MTPADILLLLLMTAPPAPPVIEYPEPRYWYPHYQYYLVSPKEVMA